MTAGFFEEAPQLFSLESRIELRPPAFKRDKKLLISIHGQGHSDAGMQVITAILIRGTPMEEELWKEGKDVEWTEKDQEQMHRDYLVWKERDKVSNTLWGIVGIASMVLMVVVPPALPLWFIVMCIAIPKTSGKTNPYDERQHNPTWLKRLGRISEAKRRAKDSYGIDDPKFF